MPMLKMLKIHFFPLCVEERFLGYSMCTHLEANFKEISTLKYVWQKKANLQKLENSWGKNNLSSNFQIYRTCAHYLKKMMGMPSCLRQFTKELNL
jgi:hypothetical protein